MRNPFYHRQGIADPSHFYGRGELVRSLFEMIDSGQSCAVVGERRIGKSSLISYLSESSEMLSHAQGEERLVIAILDFLALHTCSPADLWLEILEALELGTDDQEVHKILSRATQDEDINYSQFRRTIRRLRRRGFRVVLLCDEFELAVQNPQFDTRFFGALRSLAGGEGVVFVTASRLSLLELEQYRDEEVRQKVLGSPFFNIFAEFSVGPFEDYEIAEMLACSLNPTPIRFSDAEVEFLSRIAGQHPYCLQLACYHLFEELRRSGLGRIQGQRSVKVRSKEYQSKIQACHQSVRNKVGHEMAKIFRNLWQHSCPQERKVLASLAVHSQDSGMLDSEELEPRILARLHVRGLVSLEERPEVRSSPLKEGSSEDSRLYRIFSELLVDWLRSNVTLPSNLLPVSEEGEEKSDGELMPRSASDLGSTTVNMKNLHEAVDSVDDGAIPNRYRIIEEIGQGGSGTVFKAWDCRLERLVAIKVLDPTIRESPGRLKSLLAEARTCAALHHPHIVTVFDIDPESGYLVQEFLPGGSLRDVLEMVPILAPFDVLRMAEQLGGALSAAHQAGVIHRDIKPENILLASRPSLRGSHVGASLLPGIKLADFGTALRFGNLHQEVQQGSVVGTLAYMAPEQLAGNELSPAADFYSVGVVLHEVCYGTLPHNHDGALEWLGPRQEGMERPFDGILRGCLAPHPRDRFSTAGHFLKAVEEVRAEFKVMAVEAVRRREASPKA